MRYTSKTQISADISVDHYYQSIALFSTPTSSRTFAGGGGDPHTHEVLEGDHAGQEAAVLGPDLSDGLPPAAVHDHAECEGVQHGVEIHALADHVDHQQQARLGESCDQQSIGSRRTKDTKQWVRDERDKKYVQRIYIHIYINHRWNEEHPSGYYLCP